MRLSDIKGQEAFKAIGSIVGCLKEMFKDAELNKIVAEQKAGWILEFFERSLEEKPEVWTKMFMVLNPDIKEEEISLGSVIRFAFEFKNDPELMSLFFSQGGQIVNSYSTPPMENTQEIVKT